MDPDARPTHLDDGEDVDAFVADNDVALVEFYTKGCSMCRAMEPVLGCVGPWNRCWDVSGHGTGAG